ncbi:MAG: hypothetical protein AB1488_06285 [Nitrospirota bacterium]
MLYLYLDESGDLKAKNAQGVVDYSIYVIYNIYKYITEVKT